MKTIIGINSLWVLLLFAFPSITHAQDSPDGVWQSVSQSEISATQPSSSNLVQPNVFRAARLNEAKLRTVLEAAPQEQTGVSAEDTPGSVVLYLPDPEGQYVASRW